jgi:hypothetical protein
MVAAMVATVLFATPAQAHGCYAVEQGGTIPTCWDQPSWMCGWSTDGNWHSAGGGYYYAYIGHIYHDGRYYRRFMYALPGPQVIMYPAVYCG